MRDASINIKKSDFIQLLKEFDVDMDVDAFFYKASKVAIHSRMVVSKEVKEKVSKFVTDNADKFNFILLTERQAMNHKCAIILKNDSAYNTLRDVTVLAEQYCKLFNLILNEGLREYVKYGLALMGNNYAINKFKYYNQKIIEQKQNELEINDNSYKKETKALLKSYQDRARVKIPKSFYIHFVRCAQICVEKDVHIENWLDAQFDYFKSMNMVPEPNQLYTPAAIDRFEKFGVVETKRDKLLRERSKKRNNE